MRINVKIHSTAEVSQKAIIGQGTSVWNWAQIREDCEIGANCVISKGVYIDVGVKIGSNCKVQNNVSIYNGVTIENGVFIGPHVCFTNDLQPRAINQDGSLKKASDWKVSKTIVKEGASIGANSTIRCGVTIGKWAMIGSGSVVTKDVLDFAVAYGNPAKMHGYVDKEGKKVKEKQEE